MTAPTIEPAATEPDGPIPDDILGAALNAAAERGSSFLPEPVEPPAPASEAPPADPVAPPAPDGDAPPADGEPEGAADPTPEVDPFATLAKDAAPLKYRMHGAEHAFDGILEVPGKGALVPADKLDAIRNYVARAESNASDIRGLLAEKQSVDRLGGLDALYKMQESNAAYDAVGTLLLKAIENPLSLVKIVGDQIVPNDEVIGLIRKEAGLAIREATITTRTSRTTAAESATQTEQEAASRAAAIPHAIDATFTDIPAADRQAAAAYFAQFEASLIRPATEAEARTLGVRPGHPVVDVAKMKPYFDQLSAARKTAQAEADAKVKAARENAVRTARPVAPPKPKPKQPREADGTFTEKPKLSRSEVFDRLRAGKSIAGRDDDE